MQKIFLSVLTLGWLLCINKDKSALSTKDKSALKSIMRNHPPPKHAALLNVLNCQTGMIINEAALSDAAIE